MICGAIQVTLKCDFACRAKKYLSGTNNGPLINQVKHFFGNIFQTSDWPARWHCGNWSDFHGWLYIISDIAIGAAYFSIPVLLYRIIRKRKDLPFPRIIWLFIAFIVLCGTTHFIDALSFWWPAYRLNALIRLFTAAVSVLAVFSLAKILPVILNLRTEAQLAKEVEERKKAEAANLRYLIQQKAAEQLMAKKDEFLSIASHELKTPITSLKSSLQLLEKIATQKKMMEPIAPFVEISLRQSNRLIRLINELLDVSRIQAGRMQLIKTNFSVAEMISECLDQSVAANAREQVKVEGDKNLEVFADYNRIVQVLSNFITNAFRYTITPPLIKISYAKVENSKTKFIVSDNGIGIESDKIKRVFDRFYRVEVTSQKHPGIGLGLYIASEIIRLHEGEIGVESIPGSGSQFWFII